MSLPPSLKLWFKIVVLLVSAFFLWYKIDWQTAWGLLQQTSLSFTLIALLGKITGIFFSAQVLRVTARLTGISLSSGEANTIYLQSYVFNLFGIGSLGSDTFKWVQLHRQSASKLKTTLMLIYEKVFGLASLVSILIISLIAVFVGNEGTLILLLPLALVLSLGAIFLFFFVAHSLPHWPLFKNTRLAHVLKEYFTALHQTQKYPTNMYARGVLFATGFYASIIISFHFLALSFVPLFPIQLSSLFIPLILLVSSLPISFQGLGVRELSTATLFFTFGYTVEQGGSVAVLLLFLNIVIILLSSLYYGISPRSKRYSLETPSRPK